MVSFVDLMTNGQSDRFGQVPAGKYDQDLPDVKYGLSGTQKRSKLFEHIFAKSIRNDGRPTGRRRQTSRPCHLEIRC